MFVYMYICMNTTMDTDCRLLYVRESVQSAQLSPVDLTNHVADRGQAGLPS